MPLRTNFERGKLVNPYESLQKGMAGMADIMTMQQKYRDDDAKAKLVADQLALDNKRADARLGIEQDAAAIAKAKEADRVAALAQAKAQEEALANVFSRLKTGGTTTVTTQVGGSKGNQAEVDAAHTYNTDVQKQQELLAKERDTAASKYDELFNKYNIHKEVDQSAPQKYNITDANRKQVVVKEYPQIPGESRRTYYETVDGKKLGGIQKLFGGYTVVDNFSDNKPADLKGYQSVVEAPLPDGSNIEDAVADTANIRAMEESGMNEIVDRYNTMKGTKKVPKLIPGKPPTTKQKEIYKKFTNAEKADNFRKAIIEDKTLTGTARMNALKNVDKMFPVKEVKGPSITEQLALAKYEHGILNDAQTVADYRSTFPNMPASIKTIKGAKAYADKQKQFKSSKFNLADALYSTMTGKDSGDIAAIDKFLEENQAKLALLPPAEQKALATKYAAKYNDEGYWDFSDIFLGGSAAGDALSK